MRRFLPAFVSRSVLSLFKKRAQIHDKCPYKNGIILVKVIMSTLINLPVAPIKFDFRHVFIPWVINYFVFCFFCFNPLRRRMYSVNAR